MRTPFTKYNIFGGLGILLCAAAIIFISPEKKTTTPSNVTQEWDDVYHWAYQLGITTIPNIKDANMDGTVYRKSAAKMVSVFAMKVLGRIPDENIPCEFTDITKEAKELQQYIQLSCKLGIMGLDYYGNPEVVFNPNYFVTRDQFVTMLSRMFFGNTYNIKPGELSFSDRVRNFFIHSLTNINKALGVDVTITTPLDWYTKHMEVIKKLGVMTDYTPTIKEFRGFVMIIMYRLENLGVTKINKLTETATNPEK